MYKEMIKNNFTIEEAAIVREDTYEMYENGEREFIFDFSQCEFIDSTGLGFLVGLHKHFVANGGKMTLTNINPNVYKVFKMTRLTNVFEIVN